MPRVFGLSCLQSMIETFRVSAHHDLGDKALFFPNASMPYHYSLSLSLSHMVKRSFMTKREEIDDYVSKMERGLKVMSEATSDSERLKSAVTELQIAASEKQEAYEVPSSISIIFCCVGLSYRLFPRILVSRQVSNLVYFAFLLFGYSLLLFSSD